MNPEPSSFPQSAIELTFTGPFAWLETPGVPSVFDRVPLGTQGIYLWAIGLEDGHLVSYVGESGRCVHTRLADHYRDHVAARYTLNEPRKYATGEKNEIWPGHLGKKKRDLGDCVRASIELAPQIAELSRQVRFFIAQFNGELRLRRRIEAAIADSLFAVPGVVGQFQDRGVRYQRRWPEEEPIRVSLNVAGGRVVLGLPSVIDA